MESETLREITSDLESGGEYAILSAIKEGRLYLAAKAGKRFVLKTSDGSARGIERLKREYGLSIDLYRNRLGRVRYLHALRLYDLRGETRAWSRPCAS